MNPKVIFKEMSLEENIEQIKWMFFDNEGEFSIREATLRYFPDLKEAISLEVEEAYKYIEGFVKECYECSFNKIKEDVNRYNNIWGKYNDDYFNELSNYLKVKWPSDKNIIEAKVGLIPVYPRYLDDFSFGLSFSLNEYSVIEVTAHETLHFIWFEKWKELYPNCERKEFDTPYLPWKYSEMVVDPIINSKNIKDILNIEERAYDSFYKLVDGNTFVMDKLKLIFLSDISIEDKITKGYECVKKTL